MDDFGRERPSLPGSTDSHEAWLHELRTPLTVVKLRLTLLRRRTRRGIDGAQLEAELDLIEASLHQLAGVIKRMDDASRRDG
jgi:signal transduction histidine kinase